MSIDIFHTLHENEIMKCPHCLRDISISWAQETELPTNKNQPLFYKTIQCIHDSCGKLTFFLYEGSSDRQIRIIATSMYGGKSQPQKLIFQYPPDQPDLQINNVNKDAKTYLNEAALCISANAFNGAASCLRKCLYSVCDDKQARGKDYAEKITNLFPHNDPYAELAHQIKWLGDNHAHNKEKSYTADDIKKAMEAVPIVIRELYTREQKARELANALRKPNSKAGKKSK